MQSTFKNRPFKIIPLVELEIKLRKDEIDKRDRIEKDIDKQISLWAESLKEIKRENILLLE